jgi:hypothetical protein
MIDINTILTQALAAAVAEATKPLVERIATLEAQLAAHAPLGVASDGYKVVQKAVYAYLDASESFWHRIECFVQTRTADAVEKAVSDAIENHEEGVDTTLNAWETALQNRVVSVEVVASRLHERTLALEKHTAVLDQHGGILEYLDNQEWFWEKVSRYITNYSDITVDELHNIKQRLVELEAHEDNVYHYDKGAVETLIEKAIDEAIDEHNERTSHYDQDDVESWIDAAVEQHEENKTHGDEDDIEEIVQKLLNNASISISV